VRPSLILLLAPLATLLVAAPARALIRLPLAPAQVADNPAERLQAPACRMDVEELSRDCGYIGLTKAGAARRTSFWSAAR
jgi:hypothetical protein